MLIPLDTLFTKMNSIKLVRRCFRTAYRIQNQHFSQNLSQKDIVVENLDGQNNGITVLSLNRPKTKNAFSKNLLKEFNEAVDQIAFQSKARVVLIRSLVPGVFCAGADLKERTTLTPEEVAAFVTGLRAFMNKIHNLPAPVISAIDGLALGGGLELALAGDLRVASSDARMGLVEGRLSVIPGAGGSQRLPRLINPAIAKELIYTSRIVDGETAKNLGIVNHCIAQNEAGDAAFVKAMEIAGEILPNGPAAVRLAKLAINKGIEVDLNTGLDIEQACYAQIIPLKDRLEGLQAFKEKRKPNFTGQ